GDKALSSLKVPAGLSVTIYDGTGYTGNSITYIEDSSNVGTTWNDKARSIIVTSRGMLSPGNAVKYGDTVQFVTSGSRYARVGTSPPTNSFIITRSGDGKYGSMVAYGDIVSLKGAS